MITHNLFTTSSELQSRVDVIAEVVRIFLCLGLVLLIFSFTDRSGKDGK